MFAQVQNNIGNVRSKRDECVQIEMEVSSWAGEEGGVWRNISHNSFRLHNFSIDEVTTHSPRILCNLNSFSTSDLLILLCFAAEVRFSYLVSVNTENPAPCKPLESVKISPMFCKLAYYQ